MILSPSDAVRELESRHFPPIFRSIIQNKVENPVLKAYCSSTRGFFHYVHSLHELLPASRYYLPLWEINVTLLDAFDLNREIFVRFNYEERTEQARGRTYQQFLTAFLLENADSGISAPALRQLVMDFGYNHLGAVEAFCKREYIGDYAQAVRDFIASIPD